MPPKWRIPSIGVLHGSVDCIHLAGSPRWDELKQTPQIHRIRSECHQFRGCNLHHTPSYGTLLRLTLHPNFDLKRFKELEQSNSGTYAITQVELAFDIRAKSVKDARRILLWIAAHVGKRYHQRANVDWVASQNKTSPPGLHPLPTIYFEHATSKVRLKVYVRDEKRPQEQFSGQIVVRLEWTLVDKEAIERHLGGNTIDHLLNADLNVFLKRNLVLAAINRKELGRLVVPSKVNSYLGARNQTGHRRNWAEIGAMRLLKRWMDTNPTYAKKPDTFINREIARCILVNPAHVKSQLKKRRKKTGSKRFTDYRIEKCMAPIPLHPRLKKRVIT